jgi:methionine-rich copper-binding protein CopC
MRPAVHRLLPAAAAACLSGALALLGPAPAALAHAALVRSEPAADAVVGSPPAQLKLHFSEELDVHASTAHASGPSGQPLDAGAHVDLDDRTLLVVDTPTVPAGPVAVRWHAVAADDKGVTEGAYAFAVAPPTADAQAAAQGLAGRDGAFVRGSGARLYWIAGGARHHVPSLAAFRALGGTWGAVQAVDDAALAGVPEEEDVVKGSGPDLFLALGPVKVWIPGGDALAARGYGGLTYRQLSDAALAALPTRNDLVRSYGPEIFVLDGGQRYHQEGLDAVAARGFQWGDLAFVPPDRLASWPEVEAPAGHAGA